MSGFAIVLTTVASAEEARRIAHSLVEARLAGCVQIAPVTSVYRWQGQVEQAEERVLSCKIAAGDFAAVEAAIRAAHSYDVPEIVMTPTNAGHRPYLDWLAAAVAR